MLNPLSLSKPLPLASAEPHPDDPCPGHPIWLAVLDVDTGDVLGVPTTHVIGKLENVDPDPSDWVEPEGPMESFGFEDWQGVGVVYAD